MGCPEKPGPSATPSPRFILPAPRKLFPPCWDDRLDQAGVEENAVSLPIFSPLHHIHPHVALMIMKPHPRPLCRTDATTAQWPEPSASRADPAHGGLSEYPPHHEVGYRRRRRGPALPPPKSSCTGNGQSRCMAQKFRERRCATHRAYAEYTTRMPAGKPARHRSHQPRLQINSDNGGRWKWTTTPNSAGQSRDQPRPTNIPVTQPPAPARSSPPPCPRSHAPSPANARSAARESRLHPLLTAP